MKLPFTKKETVKAAPASETLQSLQQDFNQVLFELGDLNYRKHMISSELNKINSEINNRVQKADDMGKRAATLRARAQEELAQKVEEGKKLEAVSNEEAPKAP